MRRVLDVENSITLRNGKIFNDPFESENTLTQVGVLCLDTDQRDIINFDHAEATKEDFTANRDKLQDLLNKQHFL